MSHFCFCRVYFYTLTAFFTEVFWEWTKEVSYWQEEIDDSCWRRWRGRKTLSRLKGTIFAPEEVTACITGEKWILRGHVDNSLTFGEDTCCQKKMIPKNPCCSKGIRLLVATVPKSICFIQLTRCPVPSGLSKYFNGLEVCPENLPEQADLVLSPLLTSGKELSITLCVTVCNRADHHVSQRGLGSLAGTQSSIFLFGPGFLYSNNIFPECFPGSATKGT